MLTLLDVKIEEWKNQAVYVYAYQEEYVYITNTNLYLICIGLLEIVNCLLQIHVKYKLKQMKNIN